MNLEVDKGERYWEQRARTKWLRYDDRNTIFFHKMAMHLRKSQLVQQLEDEQGTVHNEDRDIERMLVTTLLICFGQKEAETIGIFYLGFRDMSQMG